MLDIAKDVEEEPKKIEWIDPESPSKERAIRISLHGHCPQCGEIGGNYASPLVPDGKGFYEFPTNHECPNGHIYSDEARDKVLDEGSWRQIRKEYAEREEDKG